MVCTALKDPVGNQSIKYCREPNQNAGLAWGIKKGKNTLKVEKIRVVNLRRMKDGMAQTLCASACDLPALVANAYSELGPRSPFRQINPQSHRFCSLPPREELCSCAWGSRSWEMCYLHSAPGRTAGMLQPPAQTSI